MRRQRQPRLRLDESVFLERYWQRQPLLIKGALEGFQSPLTPEELAGLAMEEDVDSRIVSHDGGCWRLEHGPFQAQDYDRSDQWTLLVQGVDRWVPEVAELRRCVAFLPDWRFDDVMVSYAVDGGSVGPHFDRYDVFLLQGSGQRLWRLGNVCDEQTPRLDHDSLHLLESFTTVQEYLLEPGDALYVPPGVAHWGIAQGECMTYSLGFRAPRVSDLLARLTDSLLERLPAECLLADPDTGAAGRPGEITPAHLTNARNQLVDTIKSLDDGRWLGELVTDAHQGDLLDPPPAHPGAPLSLVPGARVAWSEEPEGLCVFAGGMSHSIPPELTDSVIRLCSGEGLEYPAENHNGTMDEALRDLLSFLTGAGVLWEAGND